MLPEILSILEKHAIGMILVFSLWLILFDKKAIDRINSKLFFKRFAYITIIIYYFLIIIEIIHVFRGG